MFRLDLVLLYVKGTAHRRGIVRDLSIDSKSITADTLVKKTVFKDDNAALYVLAEEADGVVGGIVTQPIFAG